MVSGGGGGVVRCTVMHSVTYCQQRANHIAYQLVLLYFVIPSGWLLILSAYSMAHKKRNKSNNIDGNWRELESGKEGKLNKITKIWEWEEC